MAGGRPPLVAKLRALIERDGPIPFERFMEVSLYEPGWGYYAGIQSESDGPFSDFQTSPQVHPIFGNLLARGLLQSWESLGCPEPFVVVELGAGEGELARQILDGLRKAQPTLATRFHAVDLRPRSESTTCSRDLTRWQDLPTLAASIRGVHAVISNEFFDALPVHRLARVGGALREVYVDWGVEGFVERVGELSAFPLAALVAHRVGSSEEGWRGEVCPRLEPTLAMIAKMIDRGVVLTIDYGYEEGNPAGRGETLLAYHRHHWNDDLYCRIGEQDLTSHLDIAAFLDLGCKVGLMPLEVTTQRDLLLRLGFAGEAERWAAREPTPGRQWQARFAMAELIDPRGLGGLKVVKQAKGLTGADVGYP